MFKEKKGMNSPKRQCTTLRKGTKVKKLQGPEEERYAINMN